MGLDDKFDEAKGKVKEEYGDATDNRDLEAEGNIEKNTAKVKDGVDNAVDDIKDKF